jgi:hypothetical protein
LSVFLHATKLTNNGTKSNLLRNKFFVSEKSSQIGHNGYVLAMVGHLKNVSPTFAEMPIELQMLNL